MSQDLANTNVVIIVFAMNGCPACEEYLPKLTRHIEGYQQLGHPFVIYEIGMRLDPGAIPILVYDAQSSDPGVQALMNQHKITGLPTTLVLPKRSQGVRWEGTLSDAQVYEILNHASVSNR